MKLFGRTFFEGKETPKQEETPNDGKMAFSTPFLKIGKGNLGTPFISPYYTISGIVQFGSDNLYPQILDQMYYTSPIHSDCIEFIAQAAVGGGYEYKNPPVTGPEKVDMYTFEKVNKFKKMFRYLPVNFLIHKRVCVLIKKDAEGKFKSMERVHPSYIRNNQSVDKFQYCTDWSRRTGLKELNKWTPEGKELESLYVYQAESVGQDVYPLPRYISALNDVFLDGEISFLQKANIQNSIWPSLAIRVPKIFGSDAERDDFKKGLSDNSGASEAGRVIVLQGQGMDNTPEVIPISTNQNDKLFDSTIENVVNKICFAHGLSPAIMGVSVPGVQGNNQQIEMLYSIFEKNVVMPFREELTEIYNDLLDVAGVKNEVIINDFQIIEKTLVEGQKTAEEQEEELTAESPLEQKIMTNDAIKNMTGRHQQQLLRVIRQYGQGKLNKKQASVLLRNGLGLSDTDIETMLTE